MPQIFKQMIAWWWAIAGIMFALMFGFNWQPAPRTPDEKSAQQIAAPKALPALGAKLDATSVSGISSGAYMAGQFQMAQAKIVTGAAIIAGGPYGCSESVFADSMPGTAR